jgi:hypothetical protein
MRPPYFKHVLELKEPDFEQHPIWICAYNTDVDEAWFEEDPADEATYRPWEGQPPYDCVHSRHRSARVAATFSLADGTELPGFCKPPNPAFGTSFTEIIRMQPLIFWNDRILDFWIGGADETVMRTVIRETYGALKRDADAIFPIRYRIPDELVSVKFRGTIDGFGRLVPPDYRKTVIER